MVDVKLKDVRMSFPDLFVAKQFVANGVPQGPAKYKATFLVKKGSENDKIIRKAILEAAKESKMGAKYPAILKSIESNPNKYCYQDGDNKDYEGYAGMMYISAKSDTKIPLKDRTINPETGKLGILTPDSNKIHGGYYYNANISIYAYNNTGWGITASLQGVQFVRPGDLFSGTKLSSDDDFEVFDSDESDDLV